MVKASAIKEHRMSFWRTECLLAEEHRSAKPHLTKMPLKIISKGSIILSVTLNMFLLKDSTNQLLASLLHTYKMRSRSKNNNKVWNGFRLVNCCWLWNWTSTFVTPRTKLRIIFFYPRLPAFRIEFDCEISSVSPLFRVLPSHLIHHCIKFVLQ